jgi:DNA-binding transcriptional LysR family regulator
VYCAVPLPALSIKLAPVLGGDKASIFKQTVCEMDTIDTIELRSLRVLDAVARHKSFSEAGRELGIPRALVSKLVAELEQKLGAKLFRRTTRKVGLTSAGTRLLNLCNPSLTNLREALLQVRTGTSEAAGSIRFSVSHAYGRKYVLPFLKDFQKQHPRVQVECILNDMLDDLVSKSLDFSIRIGPLPENDKSVRKIASLDVALAVPAAMVPKPKAFRKLEDVKTLPAIGFRVPGSGRIMPWTFTAANKKKVTIASGQPTIIVNSIEAVADLVIAGVGVAPVPRYLIEDALASGDVITLFDSYKFRDIASYILTQDFDVMSTRVRLLIDAITAPRT